MKKRDDTVRALGLTHIGTDKPTREKLRRAAAAKNITIVELMRELAEIATSQGQTAMNISAPAPGATLSSIAGTLKAVWERVEAWEQGPPVKRSLTADIKALDTLVWHAIGLASTSEDIEAIRRSAREAIARRNKQLELELNEA